MNIAYNHQKLEQKVEWTQKCEKLKDSKKNSEKDSKFPKT